MSPDQKGIETPTQERVRAFFLFTMSPDQKGIETPTKPPTYHLPTFTMSPDQKGIETIVTPLRPEGRVHNEPRSKGD